MKYLAFLLYIVIWDFGILVGTSYFVFIKGHSGWWFLLAFILLGGSFKPCHFDIGEPCSKMEKIK